MSNKWAMVVSSCAHAQQIDSSKLVESYFALVSDLVANGFLAMAARPTRTGRTVGASEYSA